MAKGNMTGSGQYRPSALRTPGSSMAVSRASNSNSNDLLGSLRTIMGELDSSNNRTRPGSDNRYGDNLLMPNPYSNFTNPMLFNPFATFANLNMYNPNSNKSPVTPASPASPKTRWDTGQDALNHINSRLTRSLQPDEIDFIRKNVNYTDGPVENTMMDSIMNLIRTNRPEIMR